MGPGHRGPSALRSGCFGIRRLTVEHKPKREAAEAAAALGAAEREVEALRAELSSAQAQAAEAVDARQHGAVLAEEATRRAVAAEAAAARAMRQAEAAEADAADVQAKLDARERLLLQYERGERH